MTALAFAQVPEAGVPAYGDYAAASGYALTTALIGVNFALSSPDAMLRAPLWATEQDVPTTALSPWLVYSPAVLGAMVSMSRAFDPDMADGDREMAVALGLGALAPATAGLVMGVIGSKRRAERARPEAWIASGPRGSFGLTVGGNF